MNDGLIDARANELEEQTNKLVAQSHAITQRLAATEALLANHLARCPGSTDEDRAASEAMIASTGEDRAAAV